MQITKVTEEDVPPSPMLKRSTDLRETDILSMRTFQSTDRHTDVSPEDLSKQWHISVSQAMKMLCKTTQKFLRSAILLLARRYCTDRVFTRKTLQGQWATDTMDGRCKSLDGNKYAQ
eukprot:14112565-Ditylum_brightwellii.AAC.1